MFLYRDHRGSLADSMKTVREYKSKSELISHLQSELDKYFAGKYDCNKITIKPYGFDERIGWNTHMVHLQGYGVFGFTNGPVKNELYIKTLLVTTIK